MVADEQSTTIHLAIELVNPSQLLNACFLSGLRRPVIRSCAGSDLFLYFRLKVVQNSLLSPAPSEGCLHVNVHPVSKDTVDGCVFSDVTERLL